MPRRARRTSARNLGEADLRARTTLSPENPPIKFTNYPNLNISEADWYALSQDVYQGILASYGERQKLEQNMKIWTAMYEMQVKEKKDWPWVGASNLFIPVTPSQLDAAVAYTTAGVLAGGRVVQVTGTDDDSSSTAAAVERYYNEQVVMQRQSTSWYDQLTKWIHQGYLYGTGILEAPWRKTTIRRNVIESTPQLDADQQPVIDDYGNPVFEQKHSQVIQIPYNDCDLKTVLLRDLLLVPSEAPDIDSAVAVARALYPYEYDLNQMVAQGIFRGDKVEDGLQYVTQGTSDISSDMQGVYNLTAGGQIRPGQAQGSQTSRFFKNRGPLKVWRYHSLEYDMNDDGEPEENIFWLCWDTMELLGWCEYDYLLQGRYYWSWAPFPRVDQFYGYSLVERLVSIQSEINALHNQRIDEATLRTSPPRTELMDVEIHNKGVQWGPGIKWKVSRHDGVQLLQLPQIPPDLQVAETLLNQYVEKLTGLSNPSIGTSSTGRRTATEMKQEAAATTTRNSLVMMRARLALRAVFNGIHHMKLQFMDDSVNVQVGQGQRVTVDRKMLMKKYIIDIVGAADPLDTNARRAEILQLFELFSQTPEYQGSPMRRYQFQRLLLESYNRADIITLLGPEEQAQQADQDAQKMAQFQQQQAMSGQPPQGQKGQQKPQGAPQ